MKICLGHRCPRHFFLFVIPDRISECEAEVAVDVKDLCTVEVCSGITVESERNAIIAVEFNAFNYAFIADEVKAVFVLRILYALVEIGNAHYETFVLEGEVTAHSGVADAHLYSDRAAASEMGKRGRVYLKEKLDKDKCVGAYVETIKSVVGC